MGRLPNNAVFHAEATLLFRAAQTHGGSLAGQNLEVNVSRPMCPNCRDTLPLIGKELGDPVVTFIAPGQQRKTMSGGHWTGIGTGKNVYFDTHWGNFWPDADSLSRYFLARPGHEWFFVNGNDGASLGVDGCDGTEHLEPRGGRIDVRLQMWGNPRLGVLLIYFKYGGGLSEAFTSKGDMTQLRNLVRTLHNDPLPVGLFIPFAKAWPAVREFIDTDGRILPKSIEWIANKDLPDDTFPDP